MSSPPRVMPASLPRLSRSDQRLVEAAKVLARKERRRFAPAFLELFDGSSRFSSGMLEQRCRLMPPFEILSCRALDLSMPCIQVQNLRLIFVGQNLVRAPAPPCKSFSVVIGPKVQPSYP